MEPNGAEAVPLLTVGNATTNVDRGPSLETGVERSVLLHERQRSSATKNITLLCLIIITLGVLIITIIALSATALLLYYRQDLMNGLNEILIMVKTITGAINDSTQQLGGVVRDAHTIAIQVQQMNAAIQKLLGGRMGI